MRAFLAFLAITIIASAGVTSFTDAQEAAPAAPAAPAATPAATPTTPEEKKVYDCENKDKKLDEGSEEDQKILKAIAAESDPEKKKAMEDCRTLRLKIGEGLGDKQELQDIDATEQAHACAADPTGPGCAGATPEEGAATETPTDPKTGPLSDHCTQNPTDASCFLVDYPKKASACDTNPTDPTCLYTKPGDEPSIFSTANDPCALDPNKIPCRSAVPGAGTTESDRTAESLARTPSGKITPTSDGGVLSGSSPFYGPRDRDGDGSTHNDKPHLGLDWRPQNLLDPGQREVLAPEQAEVVSVTTNRGNTTGSWGNNVVLRTPDGDLRFAHIDPDPNLRPGDIVQPGQSIGKISGTGTNFGQIVNQFESQGMNRDAAYTRAVEVLDPTGRWEGSGDRPYNGKSVTYPHVHISYYPNGVGTGSADPLNYYGTINRGEVYSSNGSGGVTTALPNTTPSVGIVNPPSGGSSVGTVAPSRLITISSGATLGGGGIPNNPIQFMSGALQNFGSIFGGGVNSGRSNTSLPNTGAGMTSSPAGVLGMFTSLFSGINPLASTQPNRSVNTSQPNDIFSIFTSLLGGNNNANRNVTTNNPLTTTNPAQTQQRLLDLQRAQLEEFLYTSQKYNTGNPEYYTYLDNLIALQQREIEALKNQSRVSIDEPLRRLEQAQQQNRQKISELQKSQTAISEATVQKLISEITQELDSLQKQVAQQYQIKDKPFVPFVPTKTNTAIRSDLTVVALRANSTLTNEYRFRGSLSRTLSNENDHLAFSEVGSYFGSDVTHRLLLDLSCDGTVDATREFKTPYYSILPRSDGADVLLSEYMPVTQDGLHCFAFTVDIGNDIPETNENNNTSNWREFIVGFGATAPEATTALPPLNFQISAYTAGYKTMTQNWTSEDIVISAGQEIAFRWDTPQYQQCIPLLSSLTPDVAGNLAPIERNTLSENIDLHEHTGYYELRCAIDGNTRVETIHVTVE